MKTYHKIQSLYKRDTKGNMLFGEYTLPEFEYLKDNRWTFSEKIDGTNIRLIPHQYRDEVDALFIKGKTDNAQLSTKLITNINKSIDPTKLSAVLKLKDNPGTEICLYAEGCGAGIQKGGGNYGAEQSIILFDVWINGWWLKDEDVIDIARELNIRSAPIMGYGILPEMEALVKQGIKSSFGDFPAEGLIARPSVPLFARNGDRIITKLKCKDFKHA